MIDACKFEGNDCPNRPTFHFTWAWGEEGVCCDDHRNVLETRSKQLDRRITFSSLGRGGPTRREYTPPRLTEVPADVGDLKLRLSDELERGKKLEHQIAKLERERETNIGLQRDQELRIQDLLKQNAQLKAAAANAQTEAAAALELATAPTTPAADDGEAKSETREVIEGAADAEPATPSTHGSRGRRNR